MARIDYQSDPQPNAVQNQGWGAGKNVLVTPVMRAVMGLGGRPSYGSASIMSWDDFTDEQKGRRDEWLRQLHKQAETERRHKLQKAIKIIGGAALTGGAIYALAPVAAGGAGVLSGGGGAAAAVPTTAAAGGGGTAPMLMMSGPSSISAVTAAAPTAAGGAAAATPWLKYANAAQQAYGAYSGAQEQKKLAKEAAKPRTQEQYRTPYGNEYISRLMSWILANQQAIYNQRQRTYGGPQLDFSPIAQLLAGVNPNYAGVGQPGSPYMNR